MSGHAILSASGAHRWMSCTPSARLEREFDDNSGEAAAEGSAAHALAEHKIKKALKQRSRKPVSQYDCDEMDAHTDDYMSYILEQISEARQLCADPLVLVEQKLDFSSYVPDGFGTGDCVIVGDGRIHVIDLKYGRGVLVSAEENVQMKLYALGALEMFGGIYDISTVAVTVYQPRRENISTWTVTADELRHWANTELRDKAALAFAGDGEFVPGDHCRFCRASTRCRARADEKMKLAKLEFALPPILTDDEVADILSAVADITSWASEIMAYASNAAINHGVKWPGFKLVEGRSVRKYSDEDAVARAVKEAGYKDIYRQSLITLTEMEKLLGKQTFAEVLGGLIVKPNGKPTLVPDTDKRAEISISNVNDEFVKEIQNDKE
jgi:hypothetical protein